MDPFKHIVRAWEGLTEGWRELLSRNSAALTHFIHAGKEGNKKDALDFPRWSLIAAETWETAASVIVRVEVPGMNKEDLEITVHGSTLRIRGEKRLGEDHRNGTYHLMERAYGRFERAIPLPQNIEAARAETSYKAGILTVIFPKTEHIPPKQLALK
jgi:HSP20 family protein